MAFVRSPDGTSVELLQKGDALEPAEPWSSMENTGHLVDAISPAFPVRLSPLPPGAG